MKNSLVIGVTGMAGSGKSTAVSFFQNQGFEIVYFGELTKEELVRRNLTMTEANEKNIRNALRRELGLGVYAMLSLPKIREKLQGSRQVALDGIYSWEEVKVLRRELGKDFLLLAVLSSPQKRYERLLARKARSLSLEEAVQRDQDEIENLNKGGTIAMADINIVNEKSIEEFYSKLGKVLDETKALLG